MCPFVMQTHPPPVLTRSCCICPWSHPTGAKECASGFGKHAALPHGVCPIYNEISRFTKLKQYSDPAIMRRYAKNPKKGGHRNVWM